MNFNYKRNITKYLKENDKINLNGEELCIIRKTLGLNKEIDNNMLFFYRILLMKYNGLTLTKITNDLNEIDDFNMARYFKFIEFKNNNQFVVNEEFYKLKYGNDLGVKLFKEKDLKRLINSPYKIDYWVKKGYTHDESILKVKEYKTKKSTSLKGFIKRHGKKLGSEKFKEFQETSKHTYDKFIDKYGEEIGEKKWLSYTQSKDSTSYKWALKKCNGNVSEANKLLKERKKSIKTTFEKILKKFDGDVEKATIEYEKIINSKTVKIGRASKESLKILKPFYEKLINCGYKIGDIKMGVENNYELVIYDVDTKRPYLYDFAIKSKKIIIEYNGEAWHPNYMKFSTDWLMENWCHKRSKKDAIHFINKDKNKIKIAEEHGYKILTLWSSDKLEINKERVNNFLKENKIYED